MISQIILSVQFNINEQNQIYLNLFLAIITILLTIKFGIPAIKSYRLEKKIYKLNQNALFVSSGWIESSKISYSSLDFIREMKKNQILECQKNSIEKIKKILDERKENNFINHILFIGPSLSGKTHITTSILNELQNAYVIIPNESTFIQASKISYELPDAPLNAQYKIILLDNFHEFFKGNEINPKTLIYKAIKKGYTIWANCISIEEYDRVILSLDFKDGNHSLFQKIELDEKMSNFEIKEALKALGKNRVPTTFNGRYGELIYPPSNMIKNYNLLCSNIVNKDVLLFIKQAYMLGKFLLPYTMEIDFIKKAYHKKYGEDIVLLMKALKIIEKKGFIILLNNHKTFLFDSVWINEIVEPQMRYNEFYDFWSDILPKNTVLFNNLIHNSNDYSDSILLLNEMVEEGIIPNIATYNIIINHSPNYKTAVEWFEKIDDGKANEFTFNALKIKKTTANNV